MSNQHKCAQCGDRFDPEEQPCADLENEWCEPCSDAYNAEQWAYWRPLYEGEKRAGLIDRTVPD